MRLNSQGVEALLAVYRHGTIVAAADRLGLTQSAISQRLKHFEEILGVMLLHRQRGKATITFTPEGERVLETAKRYEVLMQELEDTALERRPVLRLGGAHTIADYMLAPAVPQLLVDDGKGMRISLLVAHSIDLYDKLRQLELDVAYVTYQQTASGIETQHVLTEPYVVVSTLPNLPQEIDVLDLPLNRQINIVYGPEYQLWARRKLGSWPLKSVMINDIRLALSIMKRGEFWCIMPKLVAMAYKRDAGIPYVLLRDAPANRSVFCAFRDDLSPALKVCQKLVSVQIDTVLGDVVGNSLPA